MSGPSAHVPSRVVAAVLGHTSPAATYARYIDGAIARRTRTGA
jgi:hypothetical protein